MAATLGNCTCLAMLFACCVQVMAEKNLPKLILISMDGFGYKYLDRLPVNMTSNFHYFIDRGVKAKWVNSVFPSVTCSTHYTMITGLYPESHGLIYNRFYDPTMDEYFDFHDQLDNYFSGWYDTGAEPIYVTNHNAGDGRRTGSLLWPAGLASVKGVSPDRLIYREYLWTPLPNKERIDTLISWFTTEENPINLGLLYFTEPDELAHQHGPDSIEVDNVITGELDGALGYLKTKLEDNGLLDLMNVILTSDHGMVPAETAVNIDEFVDPSWYLTGVKDDNNRIIMQIRPTDGNEERFLKGIKGASDFLYVYRKGDQELKDLHFNDNPRIAPIILEAKEGYILITNKSLAKGGPVPRGMHGYDPKKVPDVRPFFIAWGPAFKEGLASEPFDQLDIYPLMCHILGITPAPNNGSLDNVAHILKHAPTHVNRGPSTGNNANSVELSLLASLIVALCIFGIQFRHC